MFGNSLFQILHTVILPGRRDLPLPGHLDLCLYIFQQAFPHNFALYIYHCSINTHRVYSILLLLYHNKMCSQNDITSFRWFRNAHIWTRPSPDSRSPKPAALQNRCSGHTVHLQRSNNSDRIIVE